MSNIKELTKEYLADLIRDNPTAALEYTWELRATLNSCNKRRMELASKVLEGASALQTIRASNALPKTTIDLADRALKRMGEE